MAGAFQSSAFQNTAFQTGAAPVVTTGGGAGFVIRQETHRYSYHKYHYYKELLRAERAALHRAKELKDRKKRRELLAAVEAAKQAARNLAEDEQRAKEQLHDLAVAMESAARSISVADTITRAIEVRRLAAEVMAQIEDEEETLLLLH